MLRVATTVIVAALMAVSLAGAALANHPGHGGGKTNLSDLGCGLDEIARVNAADEWECNADLTANEAAAIAAQSTADQAVSDAADAQADADTAQTTADQAVGAAAAAQTTATAAGNDAADAQITIGVLQTTLDELVTRIEALEEGGGGGGGGGPGGGGEKRVFVSSKAYAPLPAVDPECSSGGEFCVPQDGFFNSVADADALCQGIAVEVGLTNGAEGSPNFIAWLSSGAGNSPNVNFDQAAGPYVNIANEVIAIDWIDLTDGSLLIPISLDELARDRPDIGVWTGTSFDGSPTLCECDSWLGNEDNCDITIPPFMLRAGTIGDSTAITENWSDFSLPIEFAPELSLCDQPHALYCFEQ